MIKGIEKAAAAIEKAAFKGPLGIATNPDILIPSLLPLLGAGAGLALDPKSESHGALIGGGAGILASPFLMNYMLNRHKKKKVNTEDPETEQE